MFFSMDAFLFASCPALRQACIPQSDPDAWYGWGGSYDKSVFFAFFNHSHRLGLFKVIFYFPTI